jgi:hypothetical protein
MSKKSWAVAGLLLAIGASWFWTYRALDSDRIDLDPHQALGRGAARETARFLQNMGRIVLVDASFGEFKILAPLTETQIKAFRKALKKTQIKIDAIEKVAIVPPSMGRSGIFMRPGQFPDVLKRHAGADAVVLFVGLANETEIKAARTATGKPKLVLVANYEPWVKRMIASGAISLAFVPRYDEAGPVAGNDAPDLFDRNYLVVTPTTASQVPE